MNIVLGELNVISILSFLLALGVQTVWALNFINRISDRSQQALKTAEEAKKETEIVEQKMNEFLRMPLEIKEARDCCAHCKEAITILNGAFTAFQIAQASNMVSKDDLREFRIDFLNRVREIVETRGPIHQRSAGE